MNNQGDIPGIHYTETVLPAVASGANTAYEAICRNPFDNHSAYIESIAILPIEAMTGDNTNSNNWNVDLVAGTEIANLDLPTGANLVRGTETAFTFTGTAAQRTIAEGGCVLVEREETGINPVRLHGSKIIIGWKSLGAS